MNQKLLIFGDICTDNDYRSLLDSGNDIFSVELRALMKSADYIVGNLECPATNSTTPIIKCGPNLRALPKDIEYLKKVGFTALSLANNHILDYGDKAVYETFDLCKKNGISYFGAGDDQTSACKPYVLNSEQGKIGFISFAEEEFNIAHDNIPGAALFDPYYSFDLIKKLKQQVDKLIILYHGGIEHYIYPSPLLQKKCRKLVEAGADLVICQHSHCIGTIEKYMEGTVIYGQGNSVFGYREGDRNWNEGLLIDIDLCSFEVNYHLLNATTNGIILVDSKEAKKRFAKVLKLSLDLNNPDYIKKEWMDFVSRQASLYYSLLYGKGRVFNKLNRILNNRLVDFLFKKRAQMITMNIIRCDAHREVLTTMLENKVYDK